MGSPTNEPNRNPSETQHTVTLNAFSMSTKEITFAQYAQFANTNNIESNGMWAAGPYPTQRMFYGNIFYGLTYVDGDWFPPGGKANYPMVNVTWFGAAAFAQYVGGRLPTEAEWEYAARATTTTPWHTGFCLIDSQANYYWGQGMDCSTSGAISSGTTQTVGTYAPNAWGLYDMIGNVAEWCSDWWNGDYPPGAASNPTGPTTGDFRVLRGGAYNSDPRFCRSASRNNSNPGDNFSDFGFRVIFEGAGVTDASAPTVTTTTVTAIATTTATSGGNITVDGGATVTSRGVVWSTTTNPTIALATKTVDGTSTGTFVSVITGLTASMTYYVRAYATNSVGTAYGNEISFTTTTTATTSGPLNITTAAIPAGTFVMGSPTTEPDRDTDEVQHTVTLNAFSMSTKEITCAQYAQFANTNNIESDGLWAAGPYPTKPLLWADITYGLTYVGNDWVPVTGKADAPMVRATWYGAAAFAQFAGGRLPTEAEWEYAARATTNTAFNTGVCLAQANFYWEVLQMGCANSGTSPATTQNVGTYAPNAWGLYDMHGNVYEWCSDWYAAYPTTALTNPTGPATGSYHVLRGGGWYGSGARDCRSAQRFNGRPQNYSNDRGFRVVF
jgi:formylglycine-generating enzyme required for sulfatase activity